jgi:hypothetical protein
MGRRCAQGVIALRRVEVESLKGMRAALPAGPAIRESIRDSRRKTVIPHCPQRLAHRAVKNFADADRDDFCGAIRGDCSDMR